jgi:hypothetical protein
MLVRQGLGCTRLETNGALPFSDRRLA